MLMNGSNISTHNWSKSTLKLLLQLIKDDLESHQRQVSSCADQAKQLLVSGGDVLAPHEVGALSSF